MIGLDGKTESKERETAGFAYVALRCNSLVRLCNYTCLYTCVYIPGGRRWFGWLVARVTATLREIALRFLTGVGRTMRVREPELGSTREENRQGEVKREVQRDVKKRRSCVYVCRMCVWVCFTPGKTRYVPRDRNTRESDIFANIHYATDTVLQGVLLFAYDTLIHTFVAAGDLYFSQCCSQSTRHSPHRRVRTFNISSR